MTEKELIEVGKRYFHLYPERNLLFATADGNVFLDRTPAIDHARKSGIKWYELQRNQEDAKTDINPELQAKEQLEAEALTIDPHTGDYKDMLRILNALHLQPESKKKADVQAAFKNLYNELAKPAAQTEDAEPVIDNTVVDNPETQE